MSTSYGPGRYDAAYEVDGHDYPFAYVRWTLNRNMQAYLDLVARGRIDVQPLDRSRDLGRRGAGRLSRAGRCGRRAAARRADPLSGRHARSARAAGCRPGWSSAAIASAPAGPLNYALVGAGAFGTAMLVPQMKKRRDRFFLKAVVSRNASQGGNFARDNQVEILASDLGRRPERSASIDLVVIATRHHEHAGQVVRALEAGKHVFVEKPLALTWDELERVAAVYGGLDRAAAAAGRLQPPVLSGAARQSRSSSAGAGRRWCVEYRLNAGYIPLDHWVHGPQGGGRNIGEACHMYDVFRFLTGAPVSSIQARGDRSGRRCRTAATTTSARRSATRTAASRICSTPRSVRRPASARSASRCFATARPTSSTTSRS